MTDYTVQDLVPDKFFSKPLYLDKGFALTAPEMALGATVKKALLDWNFPTVQSGGEPRDEYTPDELPPETDADEATESLDSERIGKAEALYRDFEHYVETLFAQMSIYIPPKFNYMAETIKDLCNAISEDRRYLLRALRIGEPREERNYLVSHTAKSTILAIIIGSHLKLPKHRLIELGVAAMLHEAGMIGLKPELFTHPGSLSPEELKAIRTHPVLGYNLLKSFGLPLAVSVAALEHHERENGGGYPRKLTGEKITLYAKIIAVACSYEAQTNKRPYKMAKDSFSGLVDILKNAGKQYDDTVIRALVFSLSIYPIGLYVLLSDGRKGQVVDVNPADPRHPLVQILGAVNADGKTRVLKTSQGGVSIVRPLVRDELG
jgi:HD-GYP domain-containing protein (c-di-GMP phosphodiesterase class II)